MIPINLIRQYKFCPRIVYFNLLTNIKPVYPRQVNLGSEYHRLQTKMLKSRRFDKLGIEYDEILYEKYMEDYSLGICGIVDLAFVCNKTIIPVEFKDMEKKPSYSHVLQLVGYGLLLEKKYDLKFEKAFIIYSNNIKFYKIDITQKHKKDFINIINSCEELLNKAVFPNSSASESKCLQCEYLNYCDDRF